MKYKHVASALHNFGHSFVSLMNYVEGEYIDDILAKFAREAPRNEIRINFADGSVEPAMPVTLKLSKSIEYWREWLPKLLESQGVSAAAMGPVLIRYRLTRVGKEVIVEAADDRGVSHKVFVRPTL